MSPRSVLAILLLMGLTAPAMAQQSGGLMLAPGINGGPVGLARPLLSAPMPFITAQQAQGGMTANDHQAKNQAMITKLRGDAGFLGGFQFGTPLAGSRQQFQTAQALPDDGGYHYRRQHGHGQGPIIINNQGPLAVTVGDGNVVQQQSGNSAGPLAQQQIVNMPGSAAGKAINIAGAQ